MLRIHQGQTACQKIHCALSNFRRPLRIKELVCFTGEDGKTVLDTVNRMVGAGLLHVLPRGFVSQCNEPTGEVEGF